MAEFNSPLAGLFLLAFSAATLLPGGSEVALLALRAWSDYSDLTLLAVASSGNILGSVVNYWLGRSMLRFQRAKWFPVSKASMAKSQGWFRRWGQGIVLLAWVPIIGDPITVMAGVMRMGFVRFLLLVGVAKILRYVVVLQAFGLIT